jgi:L-ascorbate metabolism protein UlaG (beta-lactamase superfamily)
MTVSVQFVGTATTVLRLGGFTLLTDPNFLHRGQWAYLGKGLASRRLTDPALEIDQLPQLDAVVLSHLNGDHFDRVARRGLDRGLPILTTPHAASRLHLCRGACYRCTTTTTGCSAPRCRTSVRR